MAHVDENNANVTTGDLAIVLGFILLLVVLFSGTPDLHDAIVQYVMKQ